MRTKQRLLEVIDTLNADVVGPAAILILAYGGDVLEGYDIRKVLIDAVQRLAEAHSSPHVREIASEMLTYLRGGDHEVPQEAG